MKPESWQLKDRPRVPQETCGALAAATVCVGVCVLAAIWIVVEVLKR